LRCRYAGFSLPYERAGEWYGLSRDTVRRGVAELRSQGLLTMRMTWRATLRSPTGATEERRYTFAGPFSSQPPRETPKVVCASLLARRHGVVIFPALGKAFGMQRAYALPDGGACFESRPSSPRPA
jgi:hypothetical protein